MVFLESRAGQIVAGALSFAVLVMGAYVWVTFHGYLAWLTVVAVTALVFLFLCWIGVHIVRQARGPLVVWDKGEKHARMIGDRFIEPLPFPNLTTYHNSPRMFTPRQELPMIPEAITPDALDVEPLPFRTMYREIAPDRLVFGYRPDGSPIYGTQRQLGSGCLVVGKPDTGKSTLARYWLAQALVARWLVVILDPHGSIAEDIGESLPCYETEADIREQARYLAAVLDARLALGWKVPHQPLLVLVDEWLWHLKHAPESAYTISRIVTEARKYGMSAMLFGHSYRSSEEMGREVLDNATSQYVLWTTSLQARMAGLEMTEENKGLLQQLRTAGQGKAILSLPGAAPELAGISDTVPGDLEMLVQLYGVPVLPSVSLSEQSASEAPKTEAKTERETILAAIAAHPGWSASKIAQFLGLRNNNKISLVAALKEASDA